MCVGVALVLLVAFAVAIVNIKGDRGESEHNSGAATSSVEEYGPELEPDVAFGVVDYRFLDYCKNTLCAVAVSPNNNPAEGTDYILKTDAAGDSVWREADRDGPFSLPETEGNPFRLPILCKRDGGKMVEIPHQGVRSRRWIQFRIPRDWLTPEAVAAQRLRPGQDGRGMVPDLWVKSTVPVAQLPDCGT